MYARTHPRSNSQCWIAPVLAESLLCVDRRSSWRRYRWASIRLNTRVHVHVYIYAAVAGSHAAVCVCVCVCVQVEEALRVCYVWYATTDRVDIVGEWLHYEETSGFVTCVHCELCSKHADRLKSLRNYLVHLLLMALRGVLRKHILSLTCCQHT